MSEGMGRVPAEITGRQCVRALWLANRAYWETDNAKRKAAHHEVVTMAAANANRLAAEVADGSPVGESADDVVARWLSSVTAEMAAMDGAVTP